MSVIADVRLGIDLTGSGIRCGVRVSCWEFLRPLFDQMNSGKYDVCATMPLPASRQAWEAEHRTARKRAWKCDRDGYYACTIKREEHAADIHEINTSAAYRQGRPMSAGYSEYPPETPLPDYPCALHAIRVYAVFDAEQKLVAYTYIHRAGDLALVSQVLGHADYEEDGIMYLLFRHALEAEGAIAPGVCCYNRWDSGTDGLRFLKARIGFEETPVEWLP